MLGLVIHHMGTAPPHRIPFGLLLVSLSGGCLAGSGSLCTASEEVVFSCRYRAKLASVCALSENGRLMYVQYRFGASISEIAIPPKHPFDLGLVSGHVSSGAHGGSETLIFKKADYSYKIQTSWEMRNAKYDSAEIQVSKGEELISHFECMPIASLGRDDAGLRRLVTSSGMKAAE